MTPGQEPKRPTVQSPSARPVSVRASVPPATPRPRLTRWEALDFLLGVVAGWLWTAACCFLSLAFVDVSSGNILSSLGAGGWIPTVAGQAVGFFLLRRRCRAFARGLLLCLPVAALLVLGPWLLYFLGALLAGLTRWLFL